MMLKITKTLLGLSLGLSSALLGNAAGVRVQSAPTASTKIEPSIASNIRYSYLKTLSYLQSQLLSLKAKTVSPAENLLRAAQEPAQPDFVPEIQNLSETGAVAALAQQKKQLKPVSTDAKNLYAKMIRAQKAPYDAQMDLNPFIQKLKIDEGFALVNKTRKTAAVEVTFEGKSDDASASTKRVELAAGAQMKIEIQPNSTIQSVKLLEDASSESAQTFLNPKFAPDGTVQVYIEHQVDRHFLHQYHDFDFASRLFTDAELNQPGLSQADKQFKQDFNGACHFLDYAGKQEGVSLASIDQQRKQLYAKNNFARICTWEPDVLDSTTHRIPLVTHKIWVTSDATPTDPSPQYIKWLEQSIENNNSCASGWTHYFWIESKAKLPKLAALLENHPTIKLRELSELNTNSFKTGDLYKQAIKDRKFGKATDIIRLELLRLFGGFYLDTDYHLFQGLAPYAKAYDMIVGLEPMSPYLCNAFIGACPQHPVVEKSLDMIQRNLGPEAPEYVKNAPTNGFKTIVETGPVLLTLAFALTGGSSNSRDIVLPPQLIYPAQSPQYPYKHVVVPQGKMPAESLGAHYWNTAWMDPKFGSQG